MAKPDAKEIRKSMRKNRVTIDDKYVGSMPIFLPGETPVDPAKRDSDWLGAAFWFNYNYSNKDYIPYIFKFAKDVCDYDKNKLNSLKKLKDWELNPIANVSRIAAAGWEYNSAEIERFRNTLEELYQLSLSRIEAVNEDGDVTSSAVVPIRLTPADRTRIKVNDTVLSDWEEQVVDQWMDGNFNITFDVYSIFKKNQLKSNAIRFVEDVVRRQYDEVVDAYNSTCEDAVEAYQHIKRTNQKKMLTLMEGIFSDLESIKNSAKATRAPRVKKPKASDAQVKNLKYKKDDMASKLTSINPMLIPGKSVLWVYNTKTRKLTELRSDSIKGFEVSGTTIKNFEPSMSRITTLRKPEDVLPSILTKTVKQIDKIWKTQITTKVTEPNGRINEDCILLRVMEK